ncbi:MAG: hypothetical protein K6G55_04615 [Selenomonadaceae bacterium]|nr:hypothetical protein [Selenomonadaceae bacterium]
MDEQKKRDWSFLLTGGKPTSKQRLELKKIKDSMMNLELDVDGFDFETESSFRDFVMAKTTPGDSVVEFLKKCLEDANIEYAENGFRKLAKKDYIELFFDVFTLGITEGADSGSESDSKVEKSAADDSTKSNNDKDSEKVTIDVNDEHLTVEAMDNLYKTWKKEKTVSISYSDFVVTENIPVRAQDNFSLRLRDNAPSISYGKAALFNTHFGKTVAVGHLEGTRKEPRLVFADKDIDYNTVQKNRKHEIILFPTDENAKVFYAVECEIGFRKLEEAKRTLCIDFGTSNTTAGSYGILDEQANQPEIVEFPDVAGIETKKMFPTLVYIDSCEDGKPIRYAFGYEAKRRILADHFESRATVFHEIKSWMNDIDKEEDIFDSHGNNGKVRREDVIKAYLRHVISLSEQFFHAHFRYLHFSAPVKLKDSFLSKMRQMFPKEDGYSVLDDDSSLDEGIAIVYNHIAKRIKDMKEGSKETVFVIDCGGGTTDLAKCEYSQTAARIGEGKKILSVKTSFENGDSAFGGNNITYRILQMLKIKIDAYLLGKTNPDMLEILSDNEIEIMTKLDEEDNLLTEKEKLYKKFESDYNAAEEHIPTRYADAKFNDDKHYMRRNYNYLWQMAEAIKIEFYKSSSTVSVDFSKEADRNICIGGQEDYYLYVRKNADASMEKKIAPLGNISITIKEITRIICPDIYALLNILLSEGYQNNTLRDINFFRLSGQSCNITLFHDLMKEFVPGKKIRRKTGTDDGIKKAERLKIACIEGSIRYLMAKEFSQIKPEIEMAPPRMLYKIYEVIGDGEKKPALTNEEAILMHNFISGRRIHFVVEDNYGQQKNNVFYNFELDKNKRIDLSLADLELLLARDTYWSKYDINRHIIESLKKTTLHSKDDNEQCIFLLPSKNGYGFRIYQVRISYGSKGDTQYSLIKIQSPDRANGEYHSFEEMSSFFDGKR